MVEAWSFRVVGRVVATDFGAALEARAASLGLTGWSGEDGDDVVGTVQGDPSAIELFHTWLAGGTPGAHIDVVEGEASVVRSERTGFVRRVSARRD